MRNPFQKINQRKVVTLPQVEPDYLFRSVLRLHDWFRNHARNGWEFDHARLNDGRVEVTFCRRTRALWAFIFDNGGDA